MYAITHATALTGSSIAKNNEYRMGIKYAEYIELIVNKIENELKNEPNVIPPTLASIVQTLKSVFHKSLIGKTKYHYNNKSISTSSESLTSFST